MANADEILAIKKKIEKAEIEKNKYEGQMDMLNKKLLNLGYENIKDAITALDELEKRLEKDDQKLKDGLQELQKEIEASG